MSRAQTISVAEDDDGLRLDRWFKKHFPEIAHGRLQKLLRTGQVRLDGGRVKSNSRVVAGQAIRVPPLGDSVRAPRPTRAAPVKLDESRARDLIERVIHKDRDVLIINKPHGLAVQGGSKTNEHLDAYLDALRFDAAERPKLVHRLDRDTSGTLVLARNGKAARWLTAAFRRHETRKLYWAVAAGVPQPDQGIIDAPLDKRRTGKGEKMQIVDDGEGQRAKTVYEAIAKAGNVASWLALEPLTGRTHQLRVHAAEVLGTPVVGDGKYGGTYAFPDTDGIAKGLHLHARGLRIEVPGRPAIEVFAPLPDHMRETFRFFGFEPGQAEPGFLEP